MTKILIQTLVILACIAGLWLSISTSLKTNQDASGDVSSKLKQQIDAYHQGQTLLLAHVDTTQGYVITAIAQNSTIAEQNQKLLASIDDLTKRVLALDEENAEMAKQNADLLREIKMVNDNQTKILTAHTQTLEEAKTAAKKTQIDTSRALRAITKPTPKPWYQGLFAPKK